MIFRKILYLLKLVFAYVFIILIKAYQYIISPFTPASCRHLPTCSQYSAEAIKTHGPVEGLWLSLKRFSKCHPWGTSGFDPVPPPKKSKKEPTKK